MSVLKQELFSVWHGEKCAANKLKAVSDVVFLKIAEKLNCSKDTWDTIAAQVKIFCKRLSERWKNRTGIRVVLRKTTKLG